MDLMKTSSTDVKDVELCVRILKIGLQHYVAHDSVIEHVKGASDGRKIHNLQKLSLKF